MSRARILIFTSSHLWRNPRVLKEAATLGAAGYNVTVLSVSQRADFARLDDAVAQGQPFRREVLDLTANSPAGRGGRFRQRAVTWLARRLLRHGGPELPEALGPARALLRRARSIPADLIIAHTEIPLWAAQWLIADGRRVAVDLEDWHSQDLLPGDRRSRPLRLLQRAESLALQYAAYVSTTSQCMADALLAAYGGRAPVVVRNTFPLQSQPRTARGSVDGWPRFIWFSQTVGPGRGLEAFLAAWGQMTSPSEVVLLGDCRDNFATALRAMIPADRRAAARFLPATAPDEVPRALADCDIGLALEERTPRNKDLTISNKLFQYLNAGLAVVATGTKGQREVMNSAAGCGIIVDLADRTATAEQLDSLVTDRVHLHGMQQASRAAAEKQYCWEQDAPRLLAAVAHALKAPPAVS